MGGELTVTSTVGVGSTFRLRMPAPAMPVERPAPAPDVPAVAVVPVSAAVAGVATIASAPVSIAARAATNGVVRAVVADDSEDIRIFLTVSLRRMGLEVSPVENGEDAVHVALAEQPDIVLLDVQMPIMGGPEAAHTLRRAGFSKLVIALTAGSGDALESDLLASGFDAVVFKPVSGPHLVSVITGLLAGQRDRSTPTPVAKAAGLT
jgi:two-component system cell cycle response regulator DivK